MGGGRGRRKRRCLAADLGVGLYRRRMKVISYLGRLDRVFGVPVTTRNWNTMTTIAKVLDNGAT